MSDDISTGLSGSSAAASSAASTPASTPVADTPASATSTPAASDTTTGSTAASGEPPRERWPDILDNARKKARDEATAEWRQQYGWADQVRQNPLGFVDQLAAHPEWGPQLIQRAAKLLQQQRGKAVPVVSEEPQPDIPVMDGQGRVISQAYSAEQQRKWSEWNWQQREAQLAERFQPLEEHFQQMEERRLQGEIQQRSMDRAKSTLEGLRQNPLFQEHEAKVKQALMEHEDWGDNVEKAWNYVLTHDVIPTMGTTERQKVMTTLQTQAAGATVHPTAGQQGPPKFANFGDAAEYYAAHPDEARAMAKR